MTDDNLIYILGKRLKLHQAPDGFRTSMDSVVLAAACPARSGETILDLGCGVGSVGLCILERVEKVSLTGIDIQDSHIELATKNALDNNMADRAEFLCADVSDAKLGKTFDHVVCNPPYMEDGAHIKSPSSSKAQAMGHHDTSLQDWISCAHRHIKGQGSLTMIHDAGRIDDIIHALYGKTGGRRFGNIDIIPVVSRDQEPANRVIIRAYKHKKSKATLHSGIIMHKDNGDYTVEAENILRRAKPLC